MLSAICIFKYHFVADSFVIQRHKCVVKGKDKCGFVYYV